MTDEPLITESDIAALKARDKRWADIDLALKIDNELQNSPTVNLILGVITRRSTEAMEALIEMDPADARGISAMQERVRQARYIGNEFKRIRENGLIAEAQVKEEGNVALGGNGEEAYG